jgi:hypothetical protein
VKRGDTVYEMQAKTKGGREPVPERAADTPGDAQPTAPDTDRAGFPLLPGTAAVFASLNLFETAESLQTQLIELVDRLAKDPGGAAYCQHLVRKLKDGKLHSYSPELALFGRKLGSAAPHCGYCPRCQAKHAGRIQSACKLCGGRGWLSKEEFEACPQHERQELERLRHRQALGPTG